MNTRMTTVCTTLFSALLLMATASSAQAQLALSDSPLFLSDAVEPNVIMALDDSGSMDFETLMPTNDGALWWNSVDGSFVGRDVNNNPVPGVINFNTTGGSNVTWTKYVYLFPNGCCDTGARRTLGGGHFPIPPTDEFGFVRSPDYNRGYYDPSIDYLPWISNGARTFTDINPLNAPYDAIADTATRTLNLTANVGPAPDNNWRFLVLPGMINNAGTVQPGTFPFGAVFEDFNYFPATYYITDTTLTSVLNGTIVVCSALPNPANYELFRDALAAGTVAGTADAIGPDGACLRRIEIRPAPAGPAVYPSGRTYAEEIQNFANWFTYYRKRHQALRGGITQAFSEIDGVRVGTFRINNRNTVTMRSLTTDRVDVLEDIYTSRGTGGTPLRESLNHLGEQFERTDANKPIIAACQKNYGIAFTDGFANNSNFNFIGNVDGGEGAPYADTHTGTLADIAMEYYENFTPPGGFASGQVPVPAACANVTPDPTLDCKDDLHMSTWAVTLNAQGTIFGVTRNSATDAFLAPPIVWPPPFTQRSPLMVDDLYHAAVNGRGDMLNARTPAEIATQMSRVLATVVETEGTASAVTFNTGLLSSDSLVYQAKLDSEDWSGFLTASELDPVTGDVSATIRWDAADLLPAPGARQISTFDAAANVGVPFRSAAALPANQQADLNTNLPTGRSAQDLLDYLRGDRGNEGEDPGDFRERSARTVLGDIVHSGPVLVAEPSSNWPSVAPFPGGANAYTDFQLGATAARREAVYVGSNDGMLHGFWADVDQPGSGEEFMAYMPNMRFSATSGEGLHELANQNYVHQYFTDLTPAITDVYVSSRVDASPSWRTVLMGGMRGGARGFYALDITDPTAMSESDAANYVLWEFTNSDDNDLGYTFSEPTIALMNDGRWAAVFGNGYNNLGSGRAALFIVYLDGGLDGTWTLGSDYRKIILPANNNGLSTPQLADLDNDGVPDRAYAGDLRGNMWAFDLSSTNANSWDSAYRAGFNPRPLFRARNNNGDLQAITSKPVLARCPFDNSVVPDVMVLFGTGQYLTEGDKTTTETQTFYGVWDRGDNELDRGDLLEQFANDPSLTFDTTQLRIPTDFDFDPLSVTGWYMDLPEAGERVVSNPLVRGDIVFFNTIVPDSGDPCVVGGGGWLMSINVCDGGRPDEAAFDLNRDFVITNGDLVADPTLTDGDGNPLRSAPGGERFNASEGLPWQSSILGDRQYTPGSTGNIETRAISVGGDLLDGRLSWEQIINE
ncbi:MAG: PilC/PilY family type IV pilus protein [Pseudomonadota bacterium]